MNQKEIIEVLIPMYEEAIKANQEFKTFLGYLYWLREKNMSLGICNVIDEVLGDISDYHSEWIRPYEISWFDPFWYKMPEECETIPQAVECLQFRLNKLKEILQTL